MCQRISSHKIETMVKDNVRKIINSGNCLFREVTERDYGVDAIIECFEEGKITGKIAFLQIKGKSGEIVSLKKRPVISCTISTSNAKYALQKNIPVLLVHASLDSENMFYYAILQDLQFDLNLLESQKNVTAHIPVANLISDDTSHLVELINTYY